MHGAIAAAVQQAARILAPLDRLAVSGRRYSNRGRGHSRVPITFVTYHDPLGRFQLSYPSDWALERTGGIHVYSLHLGSFAHVSLLPASGCLCELLEREMARAGGKAELRTTREQHPECIRGTLSHKKYLYACDAKAWIQGKKKVVLFIGNVTKPQRSAGIERYEDRILAAIRRYFKTGHGGRRKKP